MQSKMYLLVISEIFVFPVPSFQKPRILVGNDDAICYKATTLASTSVQPNVYRY